MATGFAYLEGGKCDGVRHKITSGERTYGSIECRGGLYVITVPAKLHHGDRIFKYAGKAINPGTTGTLDAPQALKGWQALRKSINKGMPATLAHSQRVNKATLRTLRRARKVMK